MKKSLLIISLFVNCSVAFNQTNQDNQAKLNSNSIDALITNNGHFFQDRKLNRNGYQMNNDGAPAPGLIYSASLWFGGLDENEDLRVAATLFGIQRDFYCGPISSTNAYSSDLYLEKYYASIWTVSREEIIFHIDNHDQPGYVPPNGIKDWPANNDSDLGIEGDLAPFIDVDGDNVYNPLVGDYPCILGDMASYVIMNDVAGVHAESGGEIMGIEVHLMFYQFQSTNYIDSTTFLQVRVINKGEHEYTDFKAAMFVDGDIGCSEDDYIGTDSLRNMLFFYNAPVVDNSCNSALGFGENPPALGCVSLADDIGVGMIYNGLSFNCSQSGITYYPNNVVEFYRNMNGLWKNGEPMVYGGCGYSDSEGADVDTPTTFMYSGNPYTGEGWSEVSSGNPSGDRRGQMTLKGVQLLPGQEHVYEYAFIMNASGNHLENVNGLYAYADSVVQFYNSVILPFDCSSEGTGVVADFTPEVIDYSSFIEITRLDGRGNMGNSVDLTNATLVSILDSNSVVKPTYKQGKGPISVRIEDEANYARGHYVMKSLPTGLTQMALDTADWIIYRYDLDNGVLIDSVEFGSTLLSGETVFVEEWGISVQLEQRSYYYPSSQTPIYQNQFTDAIEATLSFADTTKTWLTGVKDLNGTEIRNWILSGFDAYAEDCYWSNQRDQERQYEQLLEGTITHFSLIRDCGPLAPVGQTNSITQGRVQARIASANGVDLVFTSDKSKWTRSVVLEMCDDTSLAEGGAEKSSPRSRASVDKNGRKAGDVDYNAVEGGLVSTQGMGWFPGYAIDVETGRRLNIVFGENSASVTANGNDMLFNPTSAIFDNDNNPVLGGQHMIYVVGENIHGSNMPIYDSCSTFFNHLQGTIPEKRDAWKSVMWVMYPLLADGFESLETEAKVRVRVSKAYENHVISNANNGNPMFEWNISENHFANLLNDDGENKNQLLVYPNPTSSQITVKWNDTLANTIRIYSPSGYVIVEKPIFENTNEMTIQLNEVPSGMYFIQVGNKCSKLIVK